MWVFVLMAPLVIPSTPVVQDNYLLVRVCSLLSGVQYVKLPIESSPVSENAGDSLLTGDIQKTVPQNHLDKIHANCKCGLNVDHLLVLTALAAFNDANVSDIFLDDRSIADAHQSFRSYLFGRAPPLIVS
ncbi:hypothetical protein DFP79_2105 [Marinomonas balearica]|uniref:Uncharacterized protein n=1 Tax=Marinomonas balearica TaxID=491947 RepID=A0A4R6M795_9GAMM|nr:hypothetical protein DFP79_2105 [Marinomonas balearica]